MSTMNLSLDAAEQQLLELLESDSVPDDAMLYGEAHGYLCALAIQPGPFDPAHALKEILGGNVSDSVDAAMLETIQTIHADLLQQLSNGDAPELPCDPDAESDTESEQPPLQSWAVGFMEAFFQQPEAWSGPPEELVGELTLPILCVSGLLDEDELQDIADHPDLVLSMCDQIPDVLIDLFLLYHAPE